MEDYSELGKSGRILCSRSRSLYWNTKARIKDTRVSIQFSISCNGMRRGGRQIKYLLVNIRNKDKVNIK